MNNNIKGFLTRTVGYLWIANIFVILFILLGLWFAGRPPPNRAIDISGFKDTVNMWMYFVQPSCAILLYWNNFLLGKISGTKKGIPVLNSFILFIFAVCCALNTILFLNGKLTHESLFKTVFTIIYWVITAIFIGFPTFKIIRQVYYENRR